MKQETRFSTVLQHENHQFWYQHVITESFCFQNQFAIAAHFWNSTMNLILKYVTVNDKVKLMLVTSIEVTNIMFIRPTSKNLSPS